MKKALMMIAGAILLIGGVFEIYDTFNYDDASAPVSYAIGQPVTDKDGVQFTVTSVQDATTIGDEGYYPATTSNNFVVVNIQITNGSKEAYDVNSLRFLLLADGEEHEYAEDTVFAKENMLSLDTLNPGLSKEYCIAYETAFKHTDKDCRLKILSNAFSNQDYVYIDLK